MLDTTEFQDAIREAHGCGSSLIESVAIDEYLQGNAKAKRCYAWTHIDANGRKVHTVILGVAPVISPRTAVRAAIITEVRRKDRA
jgi:hypothetical protein